MKIYLATNNRHKKKELEQILSHCSLILPDDEGINFTCEEDGTTYFENAYKKAKTLFQITGKPILADDSGLSVAAMEGAPGIYSARFGDSLNRRLTQEQKNDLIREHVADAEDKSAFFVCHLVLILDEYRFFSVQETVCGQISDFSSGSRGFGYDPIFYLPDRKMTMASLSEEEKNKISHRGKAAQKMKLLIQSLKGENG